jgi:hypothetical protein
MGFEFAAEIAVIGIDVGKKTFRVAAQRGGAFLVEANGRLIDLKPGLVDTVACTALIIWRVSSSRLDMTGGLNKSFAGGSAY